MNITDFLSARIDEDEAAARAATPGTWSWEPPSGRDWPHGDESLVSDVADAVLYGWGYDASGIHGADEDRAHIVRWQPKRALAECEAKRRTLQRHGGCAGEFDCGACFYDDEAHCRALRELALPYADHPAYDPAWSFR